MRFCPECGAKLGESQKFCGECGADLRDLGSNGGEPSTQSASSASFESSSFGDWSESETFTFEDDLNFDFTKGEALVRAKREEKENSVQAEKEKKALAPFEVVEMTNGYEIKRLKNKSELMVEVPSCVKSISDGAFADSDVLEVTLSDGLVKIGARAFANCVNLEKINFPLSLRIIGEESFLGCENLDVEAPIGVRCGANAFRGTIPELKKPKRRKKRGKPKSRENMKKQKVFLNKAKIIIMERMA